MKRIALGSDHAGYKLKERIKNYLKFKAYAVEDYGTNSEEPVDYPDYIRPSAESVSNGENDLGIVFGGSGNGEAMVANKVKRIRCGLCWNEESARLTKEHNNADIIALGERMLSEEKAIRIVDSLVECRISGRTSFKKDRKNRGLRFTKPCLNVTRNALALLNINGERISRSLLDQSRDSVSTDGEELKIKNYAALA